MMISIHVWHVSPRCFLLCHPFLAPRLPAALPLAFAFGLNVKQKRVYTHILANQICIAQGWLKQTCPTTRTLRHSRGWSNGWTAIRATGRPNLPFPSPEYLSMERFGTVLVAIELRSSRWRHFLWGAVLDCGAVAPAATPVCSNSKVAVEHK